MLSRAAILAAARVLGEAAASRPARVIPLGSYARGEARPDGDVEGVLLGDAVREGKVLVGPA